MNQVAVFNKTFFLPLANHYQSDAQVYKVALEKFKFKSFCCFELLKNPVIPGTWVVLGHDLKFVKI